MTEAAEWPALLVPARTIPVPTSISRQAQTALARGRRDGDAYPALDDAEGWRSQRRKGEQMMLAFLQSRISHIAAEVREITVEEAHVYIVKPANRVDDRCVYLDIHGGGLTMGGGECCRASGIGNAALVGAELWSVDYRMPPDHPYPAGLDDCLAAYRALLAHHRPEDIIVGGASAGGNLAAAMILRARDEGLPLPAAVLLLSPELDLTESGDSFRTNMGIDTVLTESLMPANQLYAGGHDLSHPYLSPLLGDVSRGFPPSFITAGTRDLFLSNAARMHRALRRADIKAELHVFEAAPHGKSLFTGTPEEEDLNAEIRRFVDSQWRR